MLTQEELDKLLEEGLDDSSTNSSEPNESKEAQDNETGSKQGQENKEVSSKDTKSTDTGISSEESSTGDEVDWSDAFKEAASAGDTAAAKAINDGSVDEVVNEMKSEQPQAQSAGFNEFKNANTNRQEPNKESIEHPNLDFIMDLPLDVSVELGRCRMPIRELLQLGQGSVVELNKMAGEPADIYVNQKLMAKGEIVVVNEKFGVRLTEIISPADRVKGLG